MNRNGNIEIFCIKKGETPGLTLEIIEELRKNNIGVQELSSGQLHYDTIPAQQTDTFTKIYKLNLNNAPQNNFRGNTGKNGFFEQKSENQQNSKDFPSFEEKYPKLWNELSKKSNIRVILEQDSVTIVTLGKLLDDETLEEMEKTGLNFKYQLPEPMNLNLPQNAIPLGKYVAKKTGTSKMKF